LYAIYANLRVYTGAPTVPLQVIDTDIINAWTNGTDITFTTGILKFLNGNEDEIATVLGHEMAHVMLHHMLNTDPTLMTIDKEGQADKMGAFFTLRAGYDICEGRKFYLQLDKMGSGDQANPEMWEHPSYSYRYYSISMPWCR